MKLTKEKIAEFKKLGYIIPLKKGNKTNDYMKVQGRLILLEENYPNYSIHTELLQLDLAQKIVIFKAKVIDPEGVTRATGHAKEIIGSSIVNKTSYLENCETSAVGRALGNFGLGIEFGVASAEEVLHAFKAQDEIERAKKEYLSKGNKEYPLATDEIIENTVKYLKEKSQDVEKDLNAFKQKYGPLGFNKLMQAYN